MNGNELRRRDESPEAQTSYYEWVGLGMISWRTVIGTAIGSRSIKPIKVPVPSPATQGFRERRDGG